MRDRGFGRDSKRFVHGTGSGGVAAGPFLRARERSTPMPSVTFPYALTEKELAELKAHHLACGHLVRGCQDAIFRFRSQAGGGIQSDSVSFRTIEIMESVLESWCETLSILRLALNRDSLQEEPLRFNVGVSPELIANDSAQMIARFAKFAGAAHERERAPRP